MKKENMYLIFSIIFLAFGVTCTWVGLSNGMMYSNSCASVPVNEIKESISYIVVGIISLSIGLVFQYISYKVAFKDVVR